jgi:hypothetical protein
MLNRYDILFFIMAMLIGILYNDPDIPVNIGVPRKYYNIMIFVVGASFLMFYIRFALYSIYLEIIKPHDKMMCSFEDKLIDVKARVDILEEENRNKENSK